MPDKNREDEGNEVVAGVAEPEMHTYFAYVHGRTIARPPVLLQVKATDPNAAATAIAEAFHGAQVTDGVLTGFGGLDFDPQTGADGQVGFVRLFSEGSLLPVAAWRKERRDAVAALQLAASEKAAQEPNHEEVT